MLLSGVAPSLRATCVYTVAPLGGGVLLYLPFSIELSITQKCIEVLRGMDLRFQLREDKNEGY